MDFGPGAASPKGNMDPPSLHSSPPLSVPPIAVAYLELGGSGWV